MCGNPLKLLSPIFGLYESNRLNNKALRAQESANKKAEAAAKLTAQKAEEATNRANAKSPDTMALRSANERQAKGGISGTLLTGAAGVQPGALMLGRTTLLGS